MAPWWRCGGLGSLIANFNNCIFAGSDRDEFLFDDFSRFGVGEVDFDIAFGGAFYALVDAFTLNLDLIPENYNRLIDYGKRIKHAIMDKFMIEHPVEDLSFLYGTIFTGNAKENSHHSRNVCIFAEGEVDRSATGSGVSARAALHFVKGELGKNTPITIESILGSTMTVEVLHETTFDQRKAIIPKVSGSAHYVGKNEYYFDPEDPYREGFIFR